MIILTDKKWGYKMIKEIEPENYTELNLAQWVNSM